MNENDLILRMAGELEAKREPMEIILEPVTAFQLLALIQLALRHPGPAPKVREGGERFLGAVRTYFADCPAVLEAIRHGDDRALDTRPGPRIIEP